MSRRFTFQAEDHIETYLSLVEAIGKVDDDEELQTKVASLKIGEKVIIDSNIWLERVS